MSYPQEQIDELKKLSPNLQLAPEGGINYIFLPQLILPQGCTPQSVDALLCPVLRDNYPSTLFFSEKIVGGNSKKNWNRDGVRLLDKTWYALSWQSQPGKKLLEMIMIHLGAFQ